MMTVNEVSKLTGVSIRTLQYYDRIGLLNPAGRTEAGYRLYDDAALERLQQILLFRELEFPLKDIRKILQSPSFGPNHGTGTADHTSDDEKAASGRSDFPCKKDKNDRRKLYGIYCI